VTERRTGELEYEVETLHKALEIYTRERERFRHSHPENTGAYFLTGGYGEVDEDLLPEYVRVCPAYGAGWDRVYVKTDRAVSY